jgi:hypothetical protein
MLELNRLRTELEAACSDAGIVPASVVAYVVSAVRPEGTTPLAYLHPEGRVWPDTVAVFRAAGAQQVGLHEGTAHRLALWGDQPGIPDCALGPMLRHELEHAGRWERSGTSFFEADDLLRGAMRAAGGHGYSTLPSELEANHASAAYARRTLTEAELAELASTEECQALLAADEPPEDVVAATLGALAGRDDWGGGFDADARRAYLAQVARACSEWDPDHALALDGRGSLQIMVV